MSRESAASRTRSTVVRVTAVTLTASSRRFMLWRRLDDRPVRRGASGTPRGAGVSRARDAITREAKARGWSVNYIEWEPVGLGAEKAGPPGGWDVGLTRDGVDDQALGYNVAQVIQWLKN